MKRTKPNPRDSSPEFRKLIDLGCDETTLSSLVQGARAVTPDPSRLETRGGSAREIRAKLASARKAAGDIEGLLKTFAGEMTALMAFADRKQYADLPRLIRSFAGEFERIAEHSHTADSETIPRATLSGYVLYATGRYHDGEVCAILGGWDANSYGKWRNRHKSYVKFFCKQFRRKMAGNPQSL